MKHTKITLILIINNTYAVKIPDEHANRCIDISDFILGNTYEMLVFLSFIGDILYYVLPFTDRYEALTKNNITTRKLVGTCAHPYAYIYHMYLKRNRPAMDIGIADKYKKANISYQLQKSKDAFLVEKVITELNTLLNFKFQRWFKINRIIDFTFKEQ